MVDLKGLQIRKRTDSEVAGGKYIRLIMEDGQKAAMHIEDNGEMYLTWDKDILHIKQEEFYTTNFYKKYGNNKL